MPLIPINALVMMTYQRDKDILSRQQIRKSLGKRWRPASRKKLLNDLRLRNGKALML